jgi:hypothetical protein
VEQDHIEHAEVSRFICQVMLEELNALANVLTNPHRAGVLAFSAHAEAFQVVGR